MISVSKCQLPVPVPHSLHRESNLEPLVNEQIGLATSAKPSIESHANFYVMRMYVCLESVCLDVRTQKVFKHSINYTVAIVQALLSYE